MDFKQNTINAAKAAKVAHEVTVVNIKRQSLLFWLTLMVAAVGAGGQWANYHINNRSAKSRIETKEEDTTLEQLRKQQQFLMMKFDSLN